MILPPLRSIPRDTPGLDETFVWGVTTQGDDWYMSFQIYDTVAPLASLKVARKVEGFNAYTWIEVPWVFVYFAFVHLLEGNKVWEIDWDLTELSFYETVYFRRTDR